MSAYLPKYAPGTQPTVIVGAGGVLGGQLITTAGLVAGAGATDVAGVAAFDQLSGGAVTVYRDGIQRLTAAATITAGQPLKAAASGQVTPYVVGTDPVNQLIGRAWSGAASTASVDVALFGV